MNPLYNQLNPGRGSDILAQFTQFKKTFTGNPQQIIQNLLNSGKISQTQMNQYAKQADDLYRQLYGK